jgi:hypothetical protein
LDRFATAATTTDGAPAPSAPALEGAHLIRSTNRINAVVEILARQGLYRRMLLHSCARTEVVWRAHR